MRTSDELPHGWVGTQLSRLRLPTRVVLYVLAVVTVAWHLYYAYANPLSKLEHSNIHLGLLLTAFFLSQFDFEPSEWRDHLFNAVSLVGLVATAASTTYVFLNFSRWLTEGRSLLIYTDLDLVVGAIIIISVIYVTGKAYGWSLSLFIVGVLFYGWAGALFPGVFQHSGYTPERLVYLNSIALDGTYGFVLQVISTWVAVFIFFAGFVEGYGGIEYILGLGRSIRKYVSTGIVQLAVISSMVMGSITGSSSANVATTGSFTIPLMKDDGVDAKYAAAIESIASSGGQILPPVMGSASFLMADILGISYFSVIRGALLPALLFYIGTVIAVHMLAKKHGWGTDDGGSASVSDRSLLGHARSSLGSLDRGSWGSSPYLLSFLVLVYMLVVLRYDPMTAGTNTIFLLIASSLLTRLYIRGPAMGTVREWFFDTVDGARIGVVNMAPLAAVGAALGIVIRILTSTGFTQKLTFEIISLSGESLLIVLLLVMFASILFGLGMPTPAAYLVVAVLTAPIVTALGVGDLTAHLFVFYFALLSALTPPVALACAVGAGIAEASFYETAREALRIGFFLFLIPFIFVYNPELIAWDGVRTFVTFGVMILGLTSIIIGFIGYRPGSSIRAARRSAYVAMGLAITFVPIYAAKVGLAVLFLLWLVYLVFTDQPVTDTVAQSS